MCFASALLWADGLKECRCNLFSELYLSGKRTYGGLLDDGVKSVTRYYLNNFTDGAKQDAIDLVTGNYAIEKGANFQGSTCALRLAFLLHVSPQPPALDVALGGYSAVQLNHNNSYNLPMLAKRMLAEFCLQLHHHIKPPAADAPSPFTDHKSPTLPLLAATLSITWALYMATLLLLVRSCPFILLQLPGSL